MPAVLLQELSPRQYGEKVEEVVVIHGWTCPKCRDICNCSTCMRNKGQKPTGHLSHTAKAAGYSSVSELLNHKGAEAAQALKEEQSILKGYSSIKGSRTFKKHGYVSNLYSRAADAEQEKSIRKISIEISKEEGNKRKRRSSDSADNDNAEATPKKIHKQKQVVADNKKKDGDNLPMFEASVPKADADSDTYMMSVHDKNLCEQEEEEAVLPHGVLITTVAGVELDEEDVGPALQFLEFCNAFAKVFELQKGEAKAILRERVKERGRRAAHSLTVQFLIQLLSLLPINSEGKSLSPSPSNKNSWMHALRKCIVESTCKVKDFPSDFSTSSSWHYEDLDPSAKLRVLNFLCDEALGSQKMRSWINEEHNKFLENKRELRDHIKAARKIVKDLKKKLKVDAAKALHSSRDGAPNSVFDHDNHNSEIMIDAEEAQDHILESLNHLPNSSRDGVTNTLYDHDTHISEIKIEAEEAETHILESLNHLPKNCGNMDSAHPRDRWFICDDEEGKLIEKHISSLRNRRKD